MEKHSNTARKWLRNVTAGWRAWRLRQWEQYPTVRLQCDDEKLPKFVRQCKTTMEVRQWLTGIKWDSLPPQQMRRYFDRDPVPQAAYIGAYLVKLACKRETMSDLRHILVAHPALVWGLGFPLKSADAAHGFDPEESVPTARHLARVLRQLPNEILQELLTAQVQQICALYGDEVGDIVSLDTKHIIAWAKENNPKAFIKEGRFDKTRQPSSDPDCKLGCKRRSNKQTPKMEGLPASKLRTNFGEFYWGYASGVVATIIPEVGTVILAEMTDTFDKGDTRYFFPLMAQVEARLGRKPRFGTLDAAFDAFYVYDYFDNPDHDGFAAVPLNLKGHPHRQFNEDGLPLCAAGLPMPIRKTYTDRTKSIIVHRRHVYACPLLFPEQTAQCCPVNHKQWPKGGCSTQIPVSDGARIRYQLDRDSDQFKSIYNQRTAVERIFSQAFALGIERPKLRNQRAITNLNSLTYLFINAKTLLRATPTGSDLDAV